nr:MAG TPA: hypothetical protein [Caudoviricetes sp.]
MFFRGQYVVRRAALAFLSFSLPIARAIFVTW